MASLRLIGLLAAGVLMAAVVNADHTPEDISKRRTSGGWDIHPVPSYPQGNGGGNPNYEGSWGNQQQQNGNYNDRNWRNNHQQQDWRNEPVRGAHHGDAGWGNDQRGHGGWNSEPVRSHHNHQGGWRSEPVRDHGHSGWGNDKNNGGHGGHHNHGGWGSQSQQHDRVVPPNRYSNNFQRYGSSY